MVSTSIVKLQRRRPICHSSRKPGDAQSLTALIRSNNPRQFVAAIPDPAAGI